MQYDLPDFDTLLFMAKNDPKGLEALRKTLLKQLIESAPEETKKRLHGLQFQIDARRQLSSNPMISCIKISEMMHDSFSSLRFLLNELTEQTNTHKLVVHGYQQNRQSTAQILPFRAP